MSKDCLNVFREVIDLRELGRMFQSDGALNLNARRPHSNAVLGTVKKG